MAVEVSPEGRRREGGVAVDSSPPLDSDLSSALAASGTGTGTTGTEVAGSGTVGSPLRLGVSRSAVSALVPGHCKGIVNMTCEFSLVDNIYYA